MSDQIETGGANSSYRGYDYQKLVTVWVALELMFGPSAQADEIIVEPASHDDVKAKLEVAAERAEASLQVKADDELHIQIKLKGAGHWSAKEFADVVNEKPAQGARGPAPRFHAKTLLLREPTRRYLFITNTSVDRALAPGRVQRPSERPSSAFIPTNLGLKGQDRASLSGRFGLIELMTPAETRRQIEQLLVEHLRLPTQNLDVCVQRLKQLVEDRLLEVPDPLRKEHIQSIAEGLGGLPHPDPELASYVPPSTRTQAEKLLGSRGAVLLIGPSGYGKSLTAKSLAYERRQSKPPFRVFRETDGLGVIDDAFATPGRVLFHLEDPWGQSGLDREAAARWTNRLRTLVAKATPDKQFVITSRTEVYREALGAQPAPIWADRVVLIDDNAYDDAARRAILHGKLSQAAAWRQDLARQHEARLLRDLRTPLELDAFDRELKAVASPADADIGKLVDRAQTDGRRQVIVDQVRGFGDAGVRGAAVFWALLRFSHEIQPDRLRALRRALDGANGREIALDDLADHLAQTQLAVREGGAYSAHSKVVEALETLASSYPRAAEVALNRAARVTGDLVKTDTTWLDEFQRLVDGARALHDKGVALDEDIVQTLDKLLTEELLAAVGKPGRFRNAWRQANWRLSDETPVGKLVHWLERGAPKEKGGFDFGWRPPKISRPDQEAVFNDARTARILKGFVAHILPRTTNNYDADDLLPWLKPFGVDLTKAFIVAGDEVVRAVQFVMSADAISECALSWPEPPYDEVWAQVEKLDAAANVALERSREERRQAWQGELDFVQQIHIQDTVEEGGPSASHYATGYVRARRKREGYAWISGHPRPDIILPLWAEVMNVNRAAVTPAELDVFFAAVGDNDSLQAAGLRVIGERRLAFGRRQVLSALTEGGPEAMGAAVRALSWLESDGEGGSGRPAAETILLGVLATLPSSRAAALAPLIAGLEIGRRKAAIADRVLAAAEPEARPAVHLSLAKHLGAKDGELLQRYRELAREANNLVAHGPRPLARLLLVISAAEGVDVSSIAKEWLASSDTADAESALAALAQFLTAHARAPIVGALAHPDYRVRRSAMRLLAPTADATQRDLILQLANDKSAPVRESLAQLIGEQNWSDGLAVLVKLLRDTRDYVRHPEINPRGEPQFEVARAAAAALDSLGPLPKDVVDGVAEILDAGEAASADVSLHAQLLGLWVNVDDPRAWQILERGLKDDRVVGQTGENLYPVRYAAAWAIVHRLQTRPLELGLAPWTAIKAAADHIDPQLAAPALTAVGIELATNCSASALMALRGENGSAARRLLALATIVDWGAARRIALQHGLFGDDHPFFTDGPDVSNDNASFPRWPITEEGRRWLDGLSGGDDVEPVLAWVMRHRTGLPLGDDDFDYSALRRQGSIPLTTFAEMFGME